MTKAFLQFLFHMSNKLNVLARGFGRETMLSKSICLTLPSNLSINLKRIAFPGSSPDCACACAYPTLLRLPDLAALSSNKGLHAPVYTSNHSCQTLQPYREHAVPVHPTRVERHSNFCTDPPSIAATISFVTSTGSTTGAMKLFGVITPRNSGVLIWPGVTRTVRMAGCDSRSSAVRERCSAVRPALAAA